MKNNGDRESPTFLIIENLKDCKQLENKLRWESTFMNLKQVEKLLGI